MIQSKAVSEFAVGDRVEVIQRVERFGFLDRIIEIGETGTVTRIDADDRSLLFGVQMDRPVAGAEETDNEVQWYFDELNPDDPMDDVRKVQG
jgi:hypothetical protein